MSGFSRAGARVNLSFQTLSSTPSLSTVTEVFSTFKTLCAAPAMRVSFVIVFSAVRSDIGLPAEGGGDILRLPRPWLTFTDVQTRR